MRLHRPVEGKVTLVTGAASGIGAATAELFARNGATVILVDVDAEAGEAGAAALRSQGESAEFLRVDITNETQVTALLDHAVSRYGRLDCAVNNAGISIAMQPLEEVSLSAWQKTVEINLTGVFLCLKNELRVMKPRKAGVIVNVASNVAFSALPNVGPYCATKYGVLGLTKVAALETAACGVRVNAVLPGLTETPLMGTITVEQVEAMRMSLPSGRTAQPLEIGEPILWLCSDAASYVSGVSLAVDFAATVR